MTYENFVYWLRGFLELQKPETLNKEQIDLIETHLNLTLNNVIKPNVFRNIKPGEFITYNDPKNDVVILNGGSC